VIHQSVAAATAKSNRPLRFTAVDYSYKQIPAK
jgi:hypothetical protein